MCNKCDSELAQYYISVSPEVFREFQDKWSEPVRMKLVHEGDGHLIAIFKLEPSDDA